MNDKLEDFRLILLLPTCRMISGLTTKIGMRKIYPLILTGMVTALALGQFLGSQPSQSEARKMEQYLSRESENLNEIVTSDGAVQIDFNEKFRSVSVARINDLGEMEVRCVSTVEALDAFRAGEMASQGKQTIER